MPDHTIHVTVDCNAQTFRYTDENGQDATDKKAYNKKTIEWEIASGARTLDIYFTKQDGTPFDYLYDHFHVEGSGKSRPQAKIRKEIPKGFGYHYKVVANKGSIDECYEDPQIIIDGNLFKNKFLLPVLIAAGVGLAIWGVKRLLQEHEQEE